jgi:hypothetical protein
MAGVQVDQIILTRRLMNDASSRGASLPYATAERGAWGMLFLTQRRLKLTPSNFREWPTAARQAARAVCGILYEVKGVDPKQCIRELDRLDALDGQDAVARWRASRVPMVLPSRPPVLSERAWIEANGY